MPRKPLTVGNWKMNGTLEETLKLVTEIRYKLPANASSDVVLAPPFTALYSAGIALQETSIYLGAQNMHWETEGAFTGEVSGVFLKEIGCQYVILGHSERRRQMYETDEMINRKAHTALTVELNPILCLGETEAERTAGKTEGVLEQQLKKMVQKIPMSEMSLVTVAYEPVWAIGTGNTAKPEDVDVTLKFLRGQLARLYDAPTADQVRLLYGGSVTPETAVSIAKVKDCDGFLVGGASLNADKFLKIIESLDKDLPKEEKN